MVASLLLCLCLATAGPVAARSSLDAELRAIYNGIKFVQEQGIESILLETDSEVVINLLKQQTMDKSIHRGLIEDCKKLIANGRWNILHTLREGNKVTDTLANLRVEQDCHLVKKIGWTGHRFNLRVKPLLNGDVINNFLEK